MKQKQKTFKLDYRSKEDLYRKIEELAQSYTPEWKFTQDNPDIGSVIAMIFADQVTDNINRYNQVIYQYHTEFVNILGVSLLPANPAFATVLMTLVEDTIPGTMIQKGTKLYTQAEGENESVTFETLHNVYITNSKLTDAFMVSARNGCFMPLLGIYEPILYAGKKEAAEKTETADDDTETQQISVLEPFELFHFTKMGIEKNALLFYHSGIIDVENNDILVRINGCQELLDGIEAGNFHFLYYSEQGIRKVEECKVKDDIVIIRKHLPNKKIRLEGKDYSLFILEEKKGIQNDLMVDNILFSSAGRSTLPDYSGTATRESEAERCLPFSDEIALHKEYYISHDSYLDKPGALITLAWHMEFEEHKVGITKEEEEAELKPIQRKPRTIWSDAIANTWAEEIIIEYYNGSGWKRILCNQDYRKVFSKAVAGDVEFTFICPEDIQSVEAGAYEGRCLRLQIVRADNCYMRPCIHHYPVLSDIRFAYSYESRYQKPEKCIAVFGTKKVDLTGALIKGEKFSAFLSSIYRETALYLGFDKKFEQGPISLFYELEENANFEGMRLQYEYSTLKGFKPLKVADHTGMMTSSNTVMFLPPPDMTAIMLEEKKRYWIKISPYHDSEILDLKNCPSICNIHLNAIESYNIDTLDEEDFFMDEVKPNMQFFLNTDHILEAQVWVNESESYTEEQMNQMLAEQGENIRIERDFLGKIDSFYVKWEEVPNFHSSQHTDRHYILDRMSSRLLFGDGIHVMVPKVVDGIAFKVIVSCCNGQAGNVSANSISDSKSNILFVDGITNPLQAFGGSDIETVESALRRGGNILSGRKRLISEHDYIREIMSFSNNIDKVKCITGQLIDGTADEHAVSIVLLMKDYKNGSYSFHKEQARLLEHLHNSCEVVATETDIRIVEPIFLRTSVKLWLEVSNIDESFETQNLFASSLEEYLEPTGKDRSKGWNIGVIPGYPQIMMKLNTLKSKAYVQKMSITVQYRDKKGIHETDLMKMQNNPYVVCCNGKHEIHIQMSTQ